MVPPTFGELQIICVVKKKLWVQLNFFLTFSIQPWFETDIRGPIITIHLFFLEYEYGSSNFKIIVVL